MAQQWNKSTGSEPYFEENLTETSAYVRSEMIFPTIGSGSSERDKRHRPILKPDLLKKVSEFNKIFACKNILNILVLFSFHRSKFYEQFVIFEIQIIIFV